MDLTASRIDAFDDWFSKFDDEDGDDFVTNKMVAPKMTVVSPGTFDDEDESWLDSSDDEDPKKNPKKKNKRKDELAYRQSGDLEKLFQATGFAKPPEDSRASSDLSPKRNRSNKALKLLRDEDEKKARRVVEDRKAIRRHSIDRRKNIAQSIHRHLSCGSESSGSDDGFAHETIDNIPVVARQRRTKRYPTKTSRPAVQLSTLYGNALPEDAAAIEQSTEIRDPELEAAALNDLSQQGPGSHARSHIRSRDPLSRSCHDPLSRSTHAGSSLRRRDPLSMSAHHPRERKPIDPLSRSSHGRPRLMKRENSFSNPLSSGSGARKSSDPLSASVHQPRGIDTRRDSQNRREDPLSRSSHGRSRTRYSSDTLKLESQPLKHSKEHDRRRSGGLSVSMHGPPRHRSREEARRRSRSPAESLGRSIHTSASAGLPRRSDPTLDKSSGGRHHSKRESVTTEEEELLRLAIGNVKQKNGCKSLPGLRERQSRRDGASVFHTTTRRRSRSPHGL